MKLIDLDPNRLNIFALDLISGVDTCICWEPGGIHCNGADQLVLMYSARYVSLFYSLIQGGDAKYSQRLVNQLF